MNKPTQNDLVVSLMTGEGVQELANMRAAHEVNERLGRWLSAALDDPSVCQEMKRDIDDWFKATMQDTTWVASPGGGWHERTNDPTTPADYAPSAGEARTSVPDARERGRPIEGWTLSGFLTKDQKCLGCGAWAPYPPAHICTKPDGSPMYSLE